MQRVHTLDQNYRSLLQKRPITIHRHEHWEDAIWYIRTMQWCNTVQWVDAIHYNAMMQYSTMSGCNVSSTAYFIWSVISSFSNLNRWFSSPGPIYHVTMSRCNTVQWVDARHYNAMMQYITMRRCNRVQWVDAIHYNAIHYHYPSSCWLLLWQSR